MDLSPAGPIGFSIHAHGRGPATYRPIVDIEDRTILIGCARCRAIPPEEVQKFVNRYVRGRLDLAPAVRRHRRAIAVGMAHHGVHECVQPIGRRAAAAYGRRIRDGVGEKTTCSRGAILWAITVLKNISRKLYALEAVHAVTPLAGTTVHLGPRRNVASEPAAIDRTSWSHGGVCTRDDVSIHHRSVGRASLSIGSAARARCTATRVGNATASPLRAGGAIDFAAAASCASESAPSCTTEPACIRPAADSSRPSHAAACHTGRASIRNRYVHARVGRSFTSALTRLVSRAVVLARLNAEERAGAGAHDLLSWSAKDRAALRVEPTTARKHRERDPGRYDDEFKSA
jgi:hypothetical protein